MSIIKSEYIRRKLSYLKSIVEDDTKQKLYDINKTAEDIFMHLLNDVYGWQLVNANDIKPNFPAIDLIDTNKEIVIQVTSSMDDSKVVRTIEKFAKFADDKYKNGAYKPYADYNLKMFYIKEKPDKFSKATQTKIDNQSMSADDFLGIEDINTKVSANPNIAKKVFKTLCKLLHDKACNSNISPQLTTKLGKSTLIGREKELQEIDEQLKASKTLLVKGIGGVGKSTIASNYLHHHKDEYAYYGFFEGLESFESQLELTFKLEIEQGQDRLDKVLRELIKLEPESNKLLVIDDVKEIKENQEKLEKILGLEHNGYRVLLTSRFKVKNVEIYPLPSLDPSDAQKLFLNNSKTEELEKVNQITKYLDYHPLFVQLVAKMIENEGYSLDEIIEKFEFGELAKIEFIDEEDGDEVSFNQNLQKLFEMQKISLKDEYLLLLKQLSVLPSIDIELSFLEKFFDKKLKSRLNFLVAQGWLIESINGYKLHQLVKEFFLVNYPPFFKEIEIIVANFLKLIDNSTDTQVAVNTVKYLSYFESLFQVFERLKIENKIIARFLGSLGHIYHSLGIYEKVELFYFKDFEMTKKLFGEVANATATSCNNLAVIYEIIGKFEKAKSLYFEALKVREELLGENHSTTGYSYSSVAGIYESMGKYKKAEPLYLKAIEIEKILGREHLNNTTIYYSNLAGLYGYMGRHKEAEELYLKVLTREEKVFGKEHSSMTGLYHNLAIHYQLVAKYENAEFYIYKVLKINKKLFEENHPSIISSYCNLAEIYRLRGMYEKAKNLNIKVLNSYKILFNEKHSSIAQSYNSLALVYTSLKEYEKVEALYLKALSINLETLGEEHPVTATFYYNLAGFYYEIEENLKKAYYFMNKVVKIRSKLLSSSHHDLINAKEGLEEIKQTLEKKIPLVSSKKLKRNDPCPCNSSKKYKKCCGKNT